MELHPRGFEEAVLEVVEIPAYAPKVELRLRIAHVEVEVLSGFYLKLRERAYSFPQHHLLALAEYARLTSFGYIVEE